MNINELYKRPIRIEGKPDDVLGFNLTVTDKETGEQINNIARIVLYLEPTQRNFADIVFYEHDENDNIAYQDGDPIIKLTTLDNPEVSVTALERFSNA